MTKNRKSTKAQAPRSAQRGRARKAKGNRPPRHLAAEPNGRPTSAGAGPPAERGQLGHSPLTDQHARGPLWVPDGVDLELVPDEVRQAIAEVVQPVYERFVLDADDPLEKSLGVTVAHLLWLEVLQQFDLKREYTQFSAVLGVTDDRSSAIEQHLRIIYSKVKVGYLLARLRELRQKWHQRSPDAASLPGATAGLSSSARLGKPTVPPAGKRGSTERGDHRPENAFS